MGCLGTHLPAHSTRPLYSRLENDLLHLHLVKQVVSLNRLRERHDLVEHEAATVSTQLSSDIGFTHLNLFWFFTNTGSASGKIDRTGQRPIWTLTFLLLPVSTYTTPIQAEQNLLIRLVAVPRNLANRSANPLPKPPNTINLTSALCTPILLITPNGLISSNAVLNAGLNPTTSITASAPLPSVTSNTLFSTASFPPSPSPAAGAAAKFNGSAPNRLATSNLAGTLSTAKTFRGPYSSADTIAHNPTGPHPTTTTVASLAGRRWSRSMAKALRAPKKPVGKMSAIRISARSSFLSLVISGGARTTVPSAWGTRTYSACPPSSCGEPKSWEWAQREEAECVQ